MKTFALTGGASGIGAAIKTRLLDAGHKLIVVDVRDADIEADLGSPAGRQAAIDAVQALAPEGLDGLLACAGVGPFVPKLELLPAVNYFGAVELVAGLRNLLEKKHGGVILVSSNSAPMSSNEAYVDALLQGDQAAVTAAIEGMEGQPLYSGSKLALARWMRANAPDYAKSGVRMNAVAPGYIETPMTAATANDPVYGDAIREFVASIPIGRPGLPEDIANSVSFLFSEQASFICGSVLFIDGGHDALMRPDSV